MIVRMPGERSEARVASQSLSVVSSPALASVRPSGEKATEVTGLVCPVKVRSSRPLAASQSLSVSPWLALASMLPSGKRLPRAQSVCPVRVRSSRPLAASQSLSVLSQLALASVRPVRGKGNRIDVVRMAGEGAHQTLRRDHVVLNRGHVEVAREFHSQIFPRSGRRQDLDGDQGLAHDDVIIVHRPPKHHDIRLERQSRPGLHNQPLRSNKQAGAGRRISRPR